MFCGECGTKNEDGALFCANCGAKLTTDSNAANAVVDTPVEATVQAETAAPVETAPAVEEVAPVEVASAEPVAPVTEPAAPVEPVASEAPAVEPTTTPVETVAAPVEPAVTPVEPVQTPVQPEVAPNNAANAQSNGEKKKPNLKVLIPIIAGAVALCLIICIVVVVNVLNTGSSGKTVTLNYYYDDATEVTYILSGANVINGTIDGDAYPVATSANNSVAVFVNDDDEFFLIQNKKITSIGTDLYDVTLSYDGSVVCYVDEDDYLYSLNTKSKKATEISEDVDTVVVSPSGKAIAYTVEEGSNDILYVTKGNKTYELSKNVYPIALDDNAKYIYYYDYSKDALYVTDTKDNRNKIDSDIYDIFAFNADCTEIVYYSSKGTYISVKGGDKEKITSNSGLPYYLGTYVGTEYNVSYTSVSTSIAYPIKSFAGQYFYLYDSIIHIDKKYSVEKVVDDIENFAVSDNLKKVYYTNYSDNLYVLNLDGKYEATKIKSDVTAFDITPDGSAVYFIVDNDTLYYQKGKKGDSKKIASDVGYINVAADGTAFFMTDYDYTEGTLYYSKNGKEKQKISSTVYTIYCYNDVNIYYSNYEDYTYDVYINKSGTKFNCILEEVE